MVVSAPARFARSRSGRAGDDEEKFEAMLGARSDSEKRRRADFVIDTNLGIEAAREQVRAILSKLGAGAPRQNS